MRSRPALVALLLLLVGCGADASKQPAADPTAPRTITVTSAAFADGDAIPVEYTCAGRGATPDVRWSGVPADSGTLALVVDDPDAPGGDYVHWIVLGIPAETGALDAGDLTPPAREVPASGGQGWTPPCPPSGTHHYRFTVYAFRSDETFSVEGAPSPTEVVAALADRAVAWGRLTGTVSAVSSGGGY